MRDAFQAIFILIMLALILGALDLMAQTTWVTCQYIPTGAIQSFPDYCPHDWVRV